MDWKDRLKAFAEANPDLPEGTDPLPEEPQTPPQPRLDIYLERKGRAGKTATIITGWTCSESELLDRASTLKQRLATGGSARGGDILVQGDRRNDCLRILKEMGYKARII